LSGSSIFTGLGDLEGVDDFLDRVVDDDADRLDVEDVEDAVMLADDPPASRI